MHGRTLNIVTRTVDNSLKKCFLGEGHEECATQACAPPLQSLLQSYLLRGPVEQTPVPQGFVSSGILIHFIIGVRWEPHLQWSDTNHRAGSWTYSPRSPSNVCPRSLHANLGAPSLTGAWAQVSCTSFDVRGVTNSKAKNPKKQKTKEHKWRPQNINKKSQTGL